MANKFVTSKNRFVIATIDGKRKFVIIKGEDEDLLLADCNNQLFYTSDNQYLQLPSKNLKTTKEREVLING